MILELFWKFLERPSRENPFDFGMGWPTSGRLILRGKSEANMINARKQTHQLLPRILTLVSHFELPNGRQFLEHSNNSGLSQSLCRHFLARADDNEAADS